MAMRLPHGLRSPSPLTATDGRALSTRQVGVLCVPLSGLLTIFFRGLLNLSKTFLDPFGNAYGGSREARATIMTDALISEVNAV